MAWQLSLFCDGRLGVCDPHEEAARGPLRAVLRPRVGQTGTPR